jgi:hypothetical protein
MRGLILSLLFALNQTMVRGEVAWFEKGAYGHGTLGMILSPILLKVMDVRVVHLHTLHRLLPLLVHGETNVCTYFT